ncbi:DegT/DnrJ/EryC1/StrS family aminotransferase [Nonlabens marinus]|uniref:Aminotransferase n=1 Tax=Nonlabens marinus S1-08 TaxID=1454201 RepID=W8VU05_9FLAO|nr:DegT/DnrJ/EryC1/StrS family aminotransferase [Nonlabens marinus]BAO54163.1 aminotransferase [Nonlabens marinus S1-08]
MDLPALQQRFAQRDREALQELQEAGQFIAGGPVDRFEADFADYCDVNHCVSCGNGLDALIILLRADQSLGNLPQNARILVPAHTYIATFLSIVEAGMIPVPVDVNPILLTVDVIEAQLGSFDAIVAVDIYGKLVDDEVYAFAKANNLHIYTDTAQSHGAKTATGVKSGARGRGSAFSFYPTKNLGAMGDAGAITCNDDLLARTARQIANYGRSSRFVNDVKGVNSRMDTLQAAFLNNRLLFLDNDNKKRYKIAQTYVEQIENEKVKLPELKFLEENAIHVFPVFVDDREKFVAYLSGHGIQTNCHYAIAPHQQDAFKELNHLQFPQTEYLHQTEVSLPCHPLLEDHEIQEIIIAINEYT